MIDLLQTYFGKAIRENTSDLQQMAKACWAALLHKVAFADAARQHRCCPPGITSWCGWRRHKGGAGEPYSPKDSLPVAVFEVLKPIWLQLTDKALLEKCTRGATQNRNEAYNGTLWSLCPKTKFVGAEVVELSAALSCIKFNDGSHAYVKVFEAMGVPPGPYAVSALQRIDATRLRFAQKKASEEARKARKRRRRVRKGIEDDVLEAEGVLYGPGVAD